MLTFITTCILISPGIDINVIIYRTEKSYQIPTRNAHMFELQTVYRLVVWEEQQQYKHSERRQEM